jgi:hypothetical protein
MAMKTTVSRQQQSYFYGDEDINITTTAFTSMVMKASVPQQQQLLLC